jgi:NAD(P)-dependent dehydrogenase (short-subunit alcohol dehydrogenase family)
MVLGRQGASVLAVARNENRLQELVCELSGKGHAYECKDLQDPANLPELMQDWAGRHGKIDGLVHAAGIQITSPLRIFNLPEYDQMWSVNVRAAFMLAKGFESRQVRQEAGSMVWVSSVAGLVGQSAISGYSSAKGALIAGARSLAVELAYKGIRVNCVAPGYVKTPMLDKVTERLGETRMQELEALHPLGIGQPPDVANACAFLLSDAARWITGTTLVVDGGYSAK